jgi:hypothetical protein
MSSRSLIALALVVAPMLARADRPLIPEAELHRLSAHEHYAAKDYAGAAAEYEAAYKIDPVPTLLYSWAQALRYGGNCDRALVVYHRWIDTGLSTAQNKAAQLGIAACKRAIVAPTRSGPARPAEADTVVVAPEPQQHRWYDDHAADALAGAGVVGIGVGVTFLAMSASSASAAANAQQLNVHDHYVAQARSRATVGAVSLGLGLAFAAAGVGVYIWHRKQYEAGFDGRVAYVAGSW